MKNSIGKDLSRIPLPVSMCVFVCAYECVYVCACVCMYAVVTMQQSNYDRFVKLNEEHKFTKLYQTTVYSQFAHTL